MGLEKLLPGLEIGSTALGAGLNLAKGIWGLSQYRKGNKAYKNLMSNQPVYKRPEEYAAELAQRKQMANQRSMPGQGYVEQNIGQSVAQAISSSERGSMSSNQYNKSVGDILSKQLNAFQDLGAQSAQWQDQQKEKYLQTLQRGAGYSDQEFMTNKMQPWEIGMNEAQSQRQAGAQNMFGGAEGMLGNVMNFVGTNYYRDMLNKLKG